MSDQAAITVATTCWECSTCCGALATLVDGRVTKIAPNAAHPGSAGMFCVKGFRGMTGITEAPGRLLHPMRRVGPRGGGQWQEISWDAALDEMADRLAAVRATYGPLSIAGATSGGYFSCAQHGRDLEGVSPSVSRPLRTKRSATARG